MLKRQFGFFLVLALMIGFSACSGKNAKPGVTSAVSSSPNMRIASSGDSGTVSEDVTATSSVGKTGSGTVSSPKSSGTSKSSSKTTGTTGNVSSTGATASTVPEDVIAIFGGASDPNQAKLKSMGQQGWYPMYSTKTNMDVTGSAVFDLSSLKQCQLTIAGLWKPNETLTDKDGNTLSGPWFSIRKDGFCSGDTGFTAALKWVAPYDGTYKVMISYSGGTSSGYATEGHYEGTGDTKYWVPAADGVYMSAYINNTKVIGLDSWTASATHRADQTDKTFDNQKLKAGQSVIIVADSKGNGGWDDPWWYVNGERTGNGAAPRPEIPPLQPDGCSGGISRPQHGISHRHNPFESKEK